MDDKIYDIINDLQFYNLQLNELRGIVETVFKWYEDNHLPRDEFASHLTDRLYILFECHGRMTDKIGNKLNVLWETANAANP